MLGILAALAFALAFIFHGAGFHPGPWIDATSMLYAGLLLLTLHILAGGPLPVVRRSQQAPPQ